LRSQRAQKGAFSTRPCYPSHWLAQATLHAVKTDALFREYEDLTMGDDSEGVWLDLADYGSEQSLEHVLSLESDALAAA